MTVLYCNVVISGATASKVSDQFILRELDRVTVKGIEAALPIFEPLNGASSEIADTYALALSKYRNRNFREAIAMWESLEDKPSKVMAARSRKFLTNPPPDDWAGEWPTPSIA